MSERKTGKTPRSVAGQQVGDRPHPYKTYLFFAIVGSSILFLSLTFMYVIWLTHNPGFVHFHMPKPFILSTIVLLSSAYFLSSARRAYIDDDNTKLLISLSVTLGLSVVFAALQAYGWMELYRKGFFIDGEPGITFLYIISGLHLIHAAGGSLYLFYLNIKVFDNWNDPVKRLLYFSNKYEGTRLELISIYWHFVDILWLVLFLTFLFTL